MPQFLVLVAAAFAGYHAFRFVRREIRRVGSELEKNRQAGGSLPRETLEKDPESGRYRPKQKH